MMLHVVSLIWQCRHREPGNLVKEKTSVYMYFKKTFLSDNVHHEI